MRLAVLCFALGAFPASAQTAESPDRPPPIQVFINSHPTLTSRSTLLSGSPVTIPFDAVQVSFVVTPVPGQVRYRLRGFNNWEQRVGQMFVGVRFYNSQNDFVDEKRVLESGRSPGWKGSLERSTFTPREESISVPKGATQAEIFLTSAGPPACMGVLAVTDVDLYRGNQNLLPSAPWSRGGSGPSMASIKTVNGKSVIMIDDNSIKTHADWSAPRIPVEAGEKLTLRWREIFSNGMGDPLVANYGSLPLGSFRFEVEEIDLAGNPTRTYGMDIKVPPPFWRTPWFWGSCLGVTALIGALAGRYASRLAMRRREDKQRAIDEERRRIARDLHDDLGARLSQISLTSSHAEGSAPTSETKDSFRSITGLAQDLSTSLSETVWMLNPKNDNLESLADFLCRMLASLCKPTGIRCRIDVQPLPEDFPVSSDFRHHVSLATREAITNSLRHSGATEIWLHIKFNAPELIVHLTDNGKGLPAEPGAGNGLTNMRQRAEALHGRFETEIPKNGGTRIIFDFPIPAFEHHP
jgi:signal transduction histidine kinase